MLEILNVSKKIVNNSRVKTNDSRSVSQTILDDLSLHVQEGEFFSLLGPSGCGKTTLLRIISGLETLSEGKILLNGQRIDQLHPQKRPFNMVFQRHALFPHLTVFDNIAFGLRLKKISEKEVQQRVDEILNLTKLADYRHRLPETLSGGQAQRAALARALVNRPKILLLDEPLSALDQKLKEHMQSELKILQKKLGLTFIYVTHDQAEALALSDRIGVMQKSRLIQVGTPEQLYTQPNSLFVADFVGSQTVIPAQVTETSDSYMMLKYGDRNIRSTNFQRGISLQNDVSFVVRPECFKISKEIQMNGHNLISGTVVQVVFRGTSKELIVELANEQVAKVQADLSTQICSGEKINLAFTHESTQVFSHN